MRRLSHFALCALLFISGARAADLQKIVQDSQRLAQSGNQMTMVLWMPPERIGGLRGEARTDRS